MRTVYLPPDAVPPAMVGNPTHLSFGHHVTDRLGIEMRSLEIAGRAFVITDTAVIALHGSVVIPALAEAGYRPEVYAIHPGEKSKSLVCATDLFAWLAGHRAERRDVIVALGGGVVGDLAGFVAATYLRGIAFVQVPTTVLAMVDSSVGGKTAVNLDAGKNLVGAFHAARLTLCDVALLVGLPQREIRAGWAEVIKTAAIFDPDLFDAIEGLDPCTLQPDRLAVVIETAVRWKERTVHVDPRERGIRIVLNFGHTLAHAIEATAGYGTYLHGEAVAIGMIGATRISVEVTQLASVVAERLVETIRAAGLPLQFDRDTSAVDAIIDRTQSDKKADRAMVRWVLLERLGRVAVTDEVPSEVVRSVVESLGA